MIKKGKKQCSRYLGSWTTVEQLLINLAECGVATGGNNAKIVSRIDYETCYECSGSTESIMYLEWEEDFSDKELEKQKEDIDKQKAKAVTRRKRDYERLKKEFGE